MEDCGPCCHCFPKQSKDIILEVNGVKAQREITRTAEVNQIEVNTSSASWDQMDLQLHPLKQRPILPVDLEIVSACAGLPWPHRGWAAEVPKTCHRVGLSHQVIFRNGSPEKAKYQQLMIQIKEHMEQPWNGAMIWPKKGNGEYDEWGKPSNRAVDFAMTWHAKGLNGDGLVRDYKLTRFLWANLWLIILALLRIIFGVQCVETVIEVAKRADTAGPVHCPVEVGKQWNSAGKKTTIREIYWVLIYSILVVMLFIELLWGVPFPEVANYH